jgi:hypothetical protein
MCWQAKNYGNKFLNWTLDEGRIERLALRKKAKRIQRLLPVSC